MDTEKAWEKLRRDWPHDTNNDAKPDSGDIFTEMHGSVKRGFVGLAAGGIAGIVGGVYLASELNGYVDALKQAPAAIQYAIDAVGGGVGGYIGAGVGAFAANVISGLRMYNKITK